MSKAIAFFPWLGVLGQPVTVGPIRLLPFSVRESKPGDQPQATQADIKAVLNAYADRPGKRVQAAVLIEVDDWRLGEAPESVVDRLFAAREALAFSALSDRKLFRGHFGYCCFDHFNLVVQRYEAGQAERFAFTTRRRDVGAGHLWTSKEFSFQRPLHVHRLDRLEFDEPLAVLMMEKIPSHWTEAVAEFNRANTDSRDVLPHVEMVMMKSAFEWLLQIDEKAQNFEEALNRCLGGFTPNKDVNGPLSSAWKIAWSKSQRPLNAWAREFCARRGEAAHGKGRRPGGWVWSEVSHLAFGSILFPLLFKKIAADAGRYQLSERDKDRLRRIDEYVLADPMAPFDDDGEFRSEHPWVVIENDIAIAGIARRLYPDMAKF